MSDSSLARMARRGGMALLGLAACASDGGGAVPADAEVALDAGDTGDAGPVGSDHGIDPMSAASDLDGAAFQVLCREMDRLIGLAGDLARSCQAEAWLASYEEDDCVAERVGCEARGGTLAGYEQGSACAKRAAAAPGCEARVVDILTCAAETGAFWASRTCDASQLLAVGPACTTDLARVCEAIFR